MKITKSVFLILMLCSTAVWAQKEVPVLINCQGRLFDGNELLNGEISMVLRVYTNETSGAYLYEDSNTVTVVEGVYSTYLGDHTTHGSLVEALSTGEAFLEVIANGIEFSPRERLVTVPYALIAERVVRAGVTAEMLGPQSVSSVHLANSTVTGEKLADGSVTPAKLNKQYWATDGNASVAGKVQFLGTLDMRPLDIRAHNKRVLFIQPGDISPNIVAGFEKNEAQGKISGAVVGGGGQDREPNRVAADFGTVSGGTANTAGGTHGVVAGGWGNAVIADRGAVGGGRDNRVSGSAGVISGGFSNRVTTSYATIGGGYQNESAGYVSSVGGGWGNVATGVVSVISGGQNNRALAPASTVGGGWMNQAEAYGAGVGGGRANRAAGDFAYVGGGTNNTALGRFAAVPGGINNTAEGTHSLAAGSRARAKHTGAFVWSDGTGEGLQSTAEHQFLIKASGNVGINTAEPTDTLTVAGTVRADTFIGDGSGLTGIKADVLTAAITDAGISAKAAIDPAKIKNTALTTATPFGGDVEGTAANLKLRKGVVSAEQLGALTQKTAFKGDVEGTFGNLKLRKGAVTADQLGALTRKTKFSGDVEGTFDNLKIRKAGFDLSAIPDGVIPESKLEGKYFRLDTAVNTDGGLIFGTDDATPLDLKVNGQRALRIYPAKNSPNLLAGFQGNTLNGKVAGAVIGGGGNQSNPNAVTESYGVISGGLGNEASSEYAVISGGFNNQVSGSAGTVAGGWNNVVSELDATVSGGQDNTAAATAATVSGGFENKAAGNYATVPGGMKNLAVGEFSYAAGRRAHAVHPGAYVWADSSNAEFASTAKDQYLIRAGGNVGIDVSNPTEKLTVAGNVAPAANGKHNLGSAQAPWQHLFLGGSIQIDKALAITVDNTPLVYLDRTGNFRTTALRLIPGEESPNIIAGHAANQVQGPGTGATISGGGNAEHPNIVSSQYGTVGGGFGNMVSGFDATIGGGQDNLADGSAATIAGGYTNVNHALFGFIGGGALNTADGNLSVISGGFSNKVAGAYAAIPGGALNQALGDYSLAAGRNSVARHTGSFVWADATNASFESTGPNQFNVRAGGGVNIYSHHLPASGVKLDPGAGAWSMLSDRAAKKNMQEVDGLLVLEQLAVMPLYSWNYAGQSDEIWHLGPTAQDFREAFGLGSDERYITTIDSDGVALSAIQGLYRLVREKDEALSSLQQENKALLNRLEKMEGRMNAFQQMMDKAEGE